MHSHPVFRRNLTGIFTAVMLPGSTHKNLLVQHKPSDCDFELKILKNKLSISSI